MSAELDRVAARIRDAHVERTPLLRVAPEHRHDGETTSVGLDRVAARIRDAHADLAPLLRVAPEHPHDGETTSVGLDRVAARIRDAHADLAPLLKVARDARIGRDEVAGADTSAVCAWNHFENIPTFFNWNNRPR